MLSYAELQNSANKVRKEVAQTTSKFTAAGDRPAPPSMAASHAVSGKESSVPEHAPPASDNNGVFPTGIMSQMKGLGNKIASASTAGSYGYGSGESGSAEHLMNVPPSRRAEKAMQYVKFWQRTGTNPMKGPRALVHHMVQTMRQNELVIHPTYVALTLILVILFAWNYIHPSGIPWKPDGLFYFHNPAYDTCVSHYTMCSRGYFVPDVKPLRVDFGGIDKPGRGGPLNACKSAFVMLLLSDDYLPSVLTSLHMIRKYSRAPADYVVVVTPMVSEEVKQVLLQSCVIVRETEAIQDPSPAQSQDPMDAGRKDMMTKLMVWALDEYEKAIYLDSDLIVLRSWDEILSFSVEHGQIFAPSKSYSDPQHFGTYMMALHPSMDTVKNMKTKLEDPSLHDMKPAEKAKIRKRLYNDNGFLNEYFSDAWLGNPAHRLPWGLVTVASDLAKSPKLVLEHVNKTSIAFKFEGMSGSKPWLKGLMTYKNDPEMMYFQKLWWKQYYEMTDRGLPSSIDMYSLLELGEYDLYWKQMYSPTMSRKWFG